MTKREIYLTKKKNLQEALDLVESGDRIAFGLYGNEPVSFLDNLHKIADHIQNVEVWISTMQKEYAFMMDNRYRDRFHMLSFFYDRNARNIHESGRVSYVPSNLHSVGDLPSYAYPVNVFVCSVTPMDDNGCVYISTDLQGTREWLVQADKVIFEINPEMPFVYGDTAVPIEMATCVYETEPRPLSEAPAVLDTGVTKKVAENVAELIDDGDCIQLGIGGLPDAVGRALKGKKDLGIHTEMIPPAIGMLMRVGAVTNERKNLNRGKTIGAFAWGDRELYRMMDHNPAFELRRSRYTNDPFVIAQNDNMVSINTALQIDLTGQICSESIGTRQFSGTGGATDFAFGAFRSKGGKGIIAITSTAKDGTMSKIRSVLAPGGVVSISRNLVQYVVTEYGVADLRGRSLRKRVDNLISVTHPDFRTELRRQANELLLW